MQLINIDLKDRKTINIICFFVFTLFILFLIKFVDIPLSNFVRSNIDTNNLFITSFSYIGSTLPMISINLIFLILYSIYNKKISKKIINFISIQVILAIFLRFLKFVFGRARPYMLDGHNNIFTFFNLSYDYSSFPSGHSFSTWVLIILLLYCFKDFFYKYRYLKYLLCIYGFLICLSRILLNVHFLSDVLTGVFLGIILTRFFIKKTF